MWSVIYFQNGCGETYIFSADSSAIWPFAVPGGLLAMKEDPEQKPPPDASEAGARALPRNFASTAPSCTRSSETEIVDTCEELMEIALLFTNETGLLDVKEVRLSFHRQSWAPTIESGMPTLRRFIRPTDWDRIETMIQNVINLPPSEIERRCYFRHPMLFRVPGASRSYMCSRQTYITLHCPQVMDDPERPIFFRMHLSLVGGLQQFFIFPYILGIAIPTDYFSEG